MQERNRASPTMFKKFNADSSVNSKGIMKSSKARKLLAAVGELYPKLGEEGILVSLFPKKTPLVVAACADKIQLVLRTDKENDIENEPLFFQQRGMPWVPTIRFLHRYPGIMKKVTVDKGAIRFVMRGANIMCVGITSPGGDLPDGLEKGDPVSIHAEGKDLPFAVGIMVMSSEEIREVNEGYAVSHIHVIEDGLWNATSIE